MEQRQNKLKGAFLVALGASSYGMLATFVKMAYHDIGISGLPFTSAEVITSQFALGLIGVSSINAISRRKKPTPKPASKDIRQLMLAGTSMGLTSVFYYLAVKFIPVSIGIVLLMQTVWMAVLLEAILDKKRPSVIKIVSVILVLAGTVLAAKLSSDLDKLDWRGLLLGLCAAASFTATMFSANRIALDLDAGRRSFYMLCGGAVIVLLFALATQRTPYNFDIFYKWGILLSVFGTILPPYLLNAGFPKTGIGLGSIVSALELPVSVGMAWLFLQESVSPVQWIGISIILFAIVLMNYKSID
ncbi:EamA family transporter [Flavobacterium silvaticum]|uniref:EamA family transporter n=1 Tax=Flavobacterium silvaticum TaxID=1852020 RepID=A0A972JHP3_9FLAO|nr:DMT family transporter [Flavobacterium silvaticum]NMH29441.1 EamA family transporter [Flavobacterium silvaticum]